MIIDVHTHLAYKNTFSKHFLNGILEDSFGQNNSAIIQTLLNSILSDKECDRLVEQMDDAGIDKSVLLMTDFGYEENMDLRVIFEANIAAQRKYPNRFEIFFGIDCRRDESYIDLFEHSIKDYDIKGLKLYPPCGYDLDDERMLKYYEICQCFELPILTHTGASNKGMYNEYDYISQINSITNKFPKLKIVMAHLTTDGFNKRIELCKKNKNIFADISAFQREIGTDELEQKLKVIFDYIPEQVLFGSDWPLYSLMGKQKKWIEFFQQNKNMSDCHKDNLFYKNYERLVNKNDKSRRC